MSNATRKIEGAAVAAKGKVEQGLGRAVNDRRLEGKGKADELGGKAMQQVARAEERVKGGVAQAAGSAEGKIGAVLGSKQLEADGKARQIKGAAKRKANRESGKVGWALLWLLGIPLPILLVMYVIFRH